MIKTTVQCLCYTIITLLSHHLLPVVAFVAFSSSCTQQKKKREGLTKIHHSNSSYQSSNYGDNQIEYNDLPLIGAERGGGLPISSLTPSPNLQPDEIPTLLMLALSKENIDSPKKDTGLITMWNFSGGNTQYIFEYNMTDFIISAHETAQEFPTSFYGAAMNGISFQMEGGINRVGGENGWIVTQVMKTVCSDGRVRRWQWELRKNRRPPNLNCWFVESIASSDRKGNFEAE